MLYQYGSNRRCFNILSERALRLSDIRKSNDYDELLIMYPYIFDEIMRQYSKAPFSFKYDNLDDYPALQALVSVTYDIVDEKIESGAFSNFVTCFSEEPDILSQWRGYANDGKGCCLGFSKSVLKKYCENSNGVLRLEKVQYISHDKLNALVQDTANEILESLKGLREWIVSEMTHDENDENTDGLLYFNFLSMIECALTNSLIYKNEGFAEEKEWRLFLGSEAYKNPSWVLGESSEMKGPRGFSETLEYLRNRIEFNVTENNISPYVPLEFKDFEEMLLCEMWLGPKSLIAETDLKLYLFKKSYTDVSIQRSKISYR